MDNRIYKEACRIESKCVHNRDDLSLSLSLLAVLQFPKIKALWQSLKLRMLSLTACGHLRKKSSGDLLVELHITLDSIGGGGVKCF